MAATCDAPRSALIFSGLVHTITGVQTRVKCPMLAGQETRFIIGRMSQLSIVGMGPGSPDFLTRSASSVLEAASTVFVDDVLHPVSRWLSPNRTVIEFDVRLVAGVIDAGPPLASPIVIGLSGNPNRGNPDVEAIFEAASGPRHDIRILPGVGFYDSARTALPSLAHTKTIQ